MGKKRVVLGLAICLVLANFYEVTCQADGNDDPNPKLDDTDNPVRVGANVWLRRE
ncbi:unnamed protein product [Arabis nemorensis]|uniref:Uncharacterized protein n=1 Tax=Arabis nemorensis TaxID=586526 RepID=A0A565B827_9BRAS|nr:unnamed protein product [Arabis nemorensis]